MQFTDLIVPLKYTHVGSEAIGPSPHKVYSQNLTSYQ